jgi:hypothetical protein
MALLDEIIKANNLDDKEYIVIAKSNGKYKIMSSHNRMSEIINYFKGLLDDALKRGQKN